MKIKSLIAAAGMFVCGTATAQYVHFSQLPNSYTNNPNAFRVLFGRAGCEFRDGLVMGDSQETCPGGQGSVYIPQLNYHSYWIAGPTSKTPWMGYYSSSGGGSSSPYAEWLVQSANAGGGVGPTIQSPATILPSFGGCITSTNTGPNVRGIQWFGQLFGLNERAENINPANLLSGLNLNYIYTYPTIDFETIVVNNPNNSNVVFQSKPNNSTQNSYFFPITTTRVSSVNTTATAGYTRFTETGFAWPPGPFPTNWHMQMEVSGDDVHKTVELICSRFVSPVIGGGICFTDASAGGYTAASILSNHNQSGPFLTTLNPDFIMLTYGANDSGQGYTPAQFETNVRTLVSWIQSFVPNSLILLVSDPFRLQPNPTYYTNMDLYSSALYNIAYNDTSGKIAFLNSRKLTDALGWNEVGYSTYLSDGVHYTGTGGIMKAAVETQELYEAFMNPACVADYNEDCGITIDDLLLFLADFEEGILEADVTGDNGVTVDDLIYYLESFERGC